MHYLKLNLFFLFAFNLNLYSQDTSWVDVHGFKTTNKDSLNTYSLKFKDEKDSNKVTLLEYSIDWELISSTHYSDYSQFLLDGTQMTYYRNGKIRRMENFSHGKNNGELRTYWPNDTLKRIDYYSNGELIEGSCFDSTGMKIPYYNFQVQPTFPGGYNEMYNFLRSNIEYPKNAKKKNIQGKVFVTFMINKDGTISAMRIYRGAHKELNDEALRVIKKMPKWIPGKIDGEFYSARFTIPINFKL